jgi:hypothetical protein
MPGPAALPILTALGSIISGALAWITPFIIKYLIVGFGIGVVTFVGVQTAVDVLETWIQGAFTGLPANIAAFLALARVDDACSLVFSAYASRISTLYGIKTITKFAFGRSDWQAGDG